jgi:plastocyanin
MGSQARRSLWRVAEAAVVVTSAVSSASAQTTHTVELIDMSFSPPDLKIDLGDTVHWVWVFGFHNVESGIVVGFDAIPDGRFRSGDPDFDLTFDLVVDRAFLDAYPAPNAVYPYYCVVHGPDGMVGSIRVTVPGDFNGDLNVDLEDYAQLADCLGGPDQTIPPTGCPALEFNRVEMDDDGDVDLRDFAAFQRAFGG